MKRCLFFLTFSLLLLALLQVCHESVTAQEPYVWKVWIRQSGCNAQTEGWFRSDGTKASEEFGYPEDLVCYDSHAEQLVNDWYIIPPDGVIYWIRFDWDKDGEWDEIIYNEYISITGNSWSKTYTHSPEEVTIGGALVTGSTPPVQLTFNTIHDWSPSITYSGKWFASGSYENLLWNIYVGPFDGSQLPNKIIVDGGEFQIGDYGTSEGDWLVVFARWYEGYAADVYFYDNYHATEEQVTAALWVDRGPSISRREAWVHPVAYMSYVDDLDPEICTCPLTTPHTVTQLTDNTLWDSDPSQSSGGQIAFGTIPASESDHEIQVYSGGSITRLTYNDIDDAGPSISDDGTRVVWSDNDYMGNTRIWKANSDTSEKSQIASGWDPEISGDGQWVVFVDDRTGNNEIYITSWNNGEAGGVWNLSNDPADDDEPSISSLADDNTYHIVWSSDRASDYEIWGCTFAPPPSAPVGGIVFPVDKFGLLAPYIALASTITIATAATTIYIKRRKKKQ